MIYQDDFYDYCWAPTYKEAAEMLTRRGNGDLLAGMEQLLKIAELNEEEGEQAEAFQSGWRYEIRAYNVVFENMKKLFATKETV